MIKPLLISSGNCTYGAFRAAFRLHQGLQKIKINSQMLVQYKEGYDDNVIMNSNLPTKIAVGLLRVKTRLNSLPLQVYQNRNSANYSVQWLPDNISSKVKSIAPDVINLHWINGGYINIESLPRFKKPIVWTLHDMWAFTGGCHYSGECELYKKSCGNCPQLGSHRKCDLSRWLWKRKTKSWKGLNFTIVTPSQWLANCAANSSLFHDLEIKVIPNGLDIQRYKPIERSLARNLLNLDLAQDKKLVLFGCSNVGDPRKGFDLLCSALQKLSQSEEQLELELLIFGSSKSALISSLGFKTHYLGRLQDDISLVTAYSASNVMVVPSVQEAFGQTASESLSCGIPVVAFSSTGVEDIVDHCENGYLAKPFEVDDLSNGIGWVLENQERYGKLCNQSRQKAEKEFSLELQARRYLEVYQECCSFQTK